MAPNIAKDVNSKKISKIREIIFYRRAFQMKYFGKMSKNEVVKVDLKIPVRHDSTSFDQSQTFFFFFKLFRTTSGVGE